MSQGRGATGIPAIRYSVIDQQIRVEPVAMQLSSDGASLDAWLSAQTGPSVWVVSEVHASQFPGGFLKEPRSGSQLSVWITPDQACHRGVRTTYTNPTNADREIRTRLKDIWPGGQEPRHRFHSIVVVRSEVFEKLTPRPQPDSSGPGHEEFQGCSEASSRVKARIEELAPSDESVLIVGEPGTGKELVARALHRRSNRSSKAFVSVNCASIPRELFDSELFGIVAGAYTGARANPGLVGTAIGGTLFLDELHALDLAHQRKLLRFVEYKEIQPVGGTPRSVDVRLIVATNRDLPSETKAGRFLLDLLGRIEMFDRIETPALAKHREEILYHARRLWSQLRVGPLNLPELAECDLKELGQYDWPGNVRELQGLLKALSVDQINSSQEALSRSVRARLIAKRFDGWRKKELPDWKSLNYPTEPYPLLDPYQHPALYAGRESEIEELLFKITQDSAPIIGLHAASGAGKSSFVLAGLVPRLNEAGIPVVVHREPRKPGLVGELVRGLLDPPDQPGEPPVEREDDVDGFVRALLAVRAYADGRRPVIVLDQFEQILAPFEESVDASSRAAAADLEQRKARRSVIASLIAATVDRPDPACHWVLVHRNDAHGELRAWLREPLRDARDLEHPWGRDRFGDFSLPTRFASEPLRPFGAPSGANSDPAATRECFLRAIRRPVELKRRDDPTSAQYPDLRLGSDTSERIAEAFAKVRLSETGRTLALMPELQVVLGHVINQDDDNKIEFDVLIDEALAKHLQRGLERIAPGDEQAQQTALVILRRLASNDGRVGPAIARSELVQQFAVLGDSRAQRDANWIIDRLVARDTGLLTPVEGDRYTLTHDSVAKAVVERAGKTTGSEIVAAWNTVRSESARYRRAVQFGDHAEQERSTTLSKRLFELIAVRQQVLIDGESRDWWAACERQQRLQASRRRKVIAVRGSLLVLFLLAIAGVAWVQERRAAERIKLRRDSLSEIAANMAKLDEVEIPSRAQAAAVEIVREIDKREELFANEPSEECLGCNEFFGTSQVIRLAEAIGYLAWAVDYCERRFAVDPSLARLVREKFQKALHHEGKPPKTVEIPEAQGFLPGSGPSLDYNEDETSPAEPIDVASFDLSQAEITEEEFEVFANKFGISWKSTRGGDYPAGNVSWFQAYAYAVSLGGRLPSEIEWERAARGTCDQFLPNDQGPVWCDADGKPIREAADLRRIAVFAEEAPERVCSRDLGPFKLCDIYGNAWEWTSSWWAYSYDEGLPGGPAGGELRSIRGGGFWVDAGDLRPAYRIRDYPRNRNDNLGFRVVLPPPPSD